MLVIKEKCPDNELNPGVQCLKNAGINVKSYNDGKDYSPTGSRDFYILMEAPSASQFDAIISTLPECFDISVIIPNTINNTTRRDLNEWYERYSKSIYCYYKRQIMIKLLPHTHEDSLEKSIHEDYINIAIMIFNKWADFYGNFVSKFYD